MGGMVAMKLAAAAPGRVDSLTLLSVTAGRWQSLPRSWRCIKYLLRAGLASTPQARAAVDLKLHYSKRTLATREAQAGGRSRRELLLEEYVATHHAAGPQPPHGTAGQLHAVWTHRLSDAEASTIRSSHCPVWFIHGRHDIIALPKFAERLAER